MTRIHQVTAAAFLLFGGAIVYLSLEELSYRSADYGPGPGFFPFWLGILLIGVSVVDIVKTTRLPREPLPEGFIPDRRGLRCILSIMGALAVYVVLVNAVGFRVMTLLFSAFLLRVLGRQSWWVTALISLVGSFVTFFVFERLQVFLPRGFFGF